MDQKKAYSLEGYLDKKSPSILKGYQKRHFAVRSEGQFLVYSKKKLVGGDVKPKGVIPIESITTISRIKGSEREFVLQTKDRQFLLRAASGSERDMWTSTIAFLQELLLQKLNNPNLQLASKNSFSIKSSEFSVKLSQKASWKELDQETKAQIMMDKEKQDIENNQEEQDVKNEEVMKSKGLYAYLEKFDPQKFRQFVKCGFLLKKGKMAKLTKAKKRWFILISSVSLIGDDANIQGPTQQDIPDAFKLNYLYYFAYDSRGDQSSYLGKINAEEIEEFELMDVDKQNSLLQVLKQSVNYGFKFRFKERQYHFFSESMTEIQAWVQAIRAVKAAKALKQQSGEEPVEELQIKKEDILLEDKMQVKIHRKIRKDKWFERMVYLKKDSINWAQQGKEDNENYVLIISIKSVVGADNEIHVYTKDEKIFKFKASSEDVKEEWIKKLEFLQQNLKGEFKDLEKATELPPEIPKEEKKTKKASSEDKTKVFSQEVEEVQNNKDMANFYENFFSTKKDSELEQKGKKQKSSFFQKIFCCCPNKGELDRGF